MHQGASTALQPTPTFIKSHCVDDLSGIIKNDLLLSKS